MNLDQYSNGECEDDRSDMQITREVKITMECKELDAHVKCGHERSLM